jgi:hydroxymethylbilane synthase
MTIPLPLRLGTRGSPLARHQAALAAAALRAAVPDLHAGDAVEIVVIRTTGDRVRDRPLAEIGGKGLFCKEIEAALLAGEIDVAVHSVKDLPTWLPDGLVLGAVLRRGDPRDALIAREGTSIAALPQGARVGSASLRRRAQLLARRPDLQIGLLRGNVETRLAKVRAGEVDATLLGLAGLQRLGLEGAASTILEPEELLPAVGQGAIGLQCRQSDERLRALLAPVDHGPSSVCISAERAMLDALDGSCHTPIAGLAPLAGGMLHLRGLVARADGTCCLTTSRDGPPSSAVELGRDAGLELRARAGPQFFD